MRFAEYVGQLSRLHADVNEELLDASITMIASDPEELLRAY